MQFPTQSPTLLHTTQLNKVRKHKICQEMQLLIAPCSPCLLLRTWHLFSIFYQFLAPYLSSSASNSSSGITGAAVCDFLLLSNTNGSAASAFSFLLWGTRSIKTNKVTVFIHKQETTHTINPCCLNRMTDNDFCCSLPLSLADTRNKVLGRRMVWGEKRSRIS